MKSKCFFIVIGCLFSLFLVLFPVYWWILRDEMETFDDQYDTTSIHAEYGSDDLKKEYLDENKEDNSSAPCPKVSVDDSRPDEYSRALLYNYALLCMRGDGGQRDYEEAFRCLLKSAKQGHVEAQNTLGDCYREGEVVDQDDAESFRWYKIAAENGHPAAQYNLALYYGEGLGVAKDTQLAKKWIYLSAENGNAEAQFTLGGVLLMMGENIAMGQEVKAETKEGIKWLRRAASQGEVRAQAVLGDVYSGLGLAFGVPVNRKEAVKWYKKAAAQGNLDAKKRLLKMGESVY